ncbi:MAG: glycoside hydrolase family 99-like domain-containing protein [Rhodocyclaceae bacterium]|nr:glycoside hydrolase family 99-like domain-containing protein [Rhodocyclaceae bacterium]MDZ4214766.1 glycoside hydrolase family 99-like domain-containing protein [Rhodocyclaceae bacterium]
MTPSPLSSDASDVKLVAFYLPQFHPIEENDTWWGKGFTEWTNVTRGVPLFSGHYQPHRPADLGYYDLRVRATRLEQIRLAKTYGINAFCYHYYWFSGKRLLEKPLDDMLADPKSDMPFCLCWANENWTRRWNGGDDDILIEQQHLADDPSRFIHDLAPFLTDKRYLRVAGKPLLIVYRPQLIPDIQSTAERWRRECLDLGIGEIHLCAALVFNNLDYHQFGFDSGVEFPPHNRNLLGVPYVHREMDFLGDFDGSAMCYHSLAVAYLKRDVSGQRVFRGVFPSWDNTSRIGNRALIFLNGTPGNYEAWLSRTVRKMREEQPAEYRLVFINAWNEWAEGCHLEPDERYGRSFLEATRRVKDGTSCLENFPDTGIELPGESGITSFLGEAGALLRKHVWVFFRWIRSRPHAISLKIPGLVRLLRRHRGAL